MVPGTYLLLSKSSANYFYMGREASVNSEWFLETSNWECCINWVLKGYNWCYLSEESSPSKILHDFLFFLESHAMNGHNLWITLWIPYERVGVRLVLSDRLQEVGKILWLPVRFQICCSGAWNYDIAREIYACVEKIIPINIRIWNLYGYVTKSSLLFTVYSKTNERKINSIPQIQVRRVHSFILPHLFWTSPKRKEQANKKSMSC